MIKKMKKILLILFILIGWSTEAQKLTLESFTLKTNDLSASIQPRVDNNSVPCALVKVQIAAQGVKFEGNVMGNVIEKTSEYWVYMPSGSKRLKVILSGYLPLEVEFSLFGINALESKLTYQLVISGVVANGQQQEAPKQQTGWLILYSTPSEADVYLTVNGVESLEGKTPFQKKMAYGSYNYRLKKNLYHDERGLANINSGRVELNPTLRPAHGRLKISSNPSGASVSIEGVRESYTTPCTTDVLPSGEYRVTLSKTKYASVTKTVTVSDGQVVPVQFDLAANFAQVTVNSLNGADIYLNGSRVGTTRYSEELTPGLYDFEARLASHRTVSRQVEVEANKPQTITLNPTPIYGSLDVVTEPMDATVTINGKGYGLTPTTIDRLLVGSYNVELTKSGYAAETQTVTIREGQTSTVTATLRNGCPVRVTASKSGARVYVDGEEVGTAPYSGTLTFGSHKLYAIADGKRSQEQEIVIRQGETATRNVELSFSANKTFTVNGVTFEMVYVEGGTFTMGATSEQGSDAYDREKPAHSVRLSNYYIGQTEVTQALWKAVMGSNPSHIKGDNLPVEKVSWDDCQEFVRKLNRLTGKTFRLPTEAEWEYAARGGSKSRGYKYSGSNDIGAVAWYFDNSGSKTHPVGTKQANELGIYDMSGNVWEWCQDWYDGYSSSTQTNPTGPYNGSSRVLRGGCWYGGAGSCRVSFRIFSYPSCRDFSIGIRLVLP